ncbi:hypothetical protein [Streptomyces sp. NRRL F-5065]|uniref:hypothetical protein n=1 Tax=Streptomyces sp. NRRL F-5065 TaxID=1463855 RepID=UPI0004C19944|nr:hypothetical protein [Streptomyces sp. NRRL F-5065]
MSDLTAIDILILPDDTMLQRAGALNAPIRASVPGVFDAVGGVIGAAAPGSLQLRGVKLAHMEVASHPGVGLTGLVVQPSQGVLDVQRALIAAVEPFVAQGGTADAYVTTAEEPEINEDTVEYVEHYVPDHSGENFIAHVTVGLAQFDFLADLEDGPFDTFTFHRAGFAVFQLGNNRTAQRELQTWEVAAGGGSRRGA